MKLPSIFNSIQKQLFFPVFAELSRAWPSSASAGLLAYHYIIVSSHLNSVQNSLWKNSSSIFSLQSIRTVFNLIISKGVRVHPSSYQLSISAFGHHYEQWTKAREEFEEAWRTLKLSSWTWVGRVPPDRNKYTRLL